MSSMRWRRFSLISLLCGVLIAPAVPGLAGQAAAATLPQYTSHFVAIPHARLADTRLGSRFGYNPSDSRTVVVKATGLKGVPADATAVVVNVTGIASRGPGVVSVYPRGFTPPVDSKLTPNVVFTAAGQTRTNLVTVRLGTGGAFAVRRTVGADITIDVVGAYAPVSPADPAVADGRFVPLTGTRRVLTAGAVAKGTSRAVDLAPGGVPATATAALVTITAKAAKGSWVAFPTGSPRPVAFDLYVDANLATRANQTIVPLNGTDSTINLFSAAGGTANVDVIGYYTGTSDAVSTDGLFVPINPLRRLDTRVNRPLAPMGPVTFEFSLVNPGVDVRGFVGNLYVSDSWDAGVVVTRPAGAASLSMPAVRIDAPRLTTSTHFTGRNSSRGVAITADKGAHMVVDVEGIFLGTRPVAVNLPVKNPTFAATAVTAVRWADAAGTHVSAVQASTTNTSNDMTRIADKSIVAAFKGMSTLAKKGNTMLFAHRTTHGGIFRYLNTMRVGGTFSLKGADGHWYHYRITRIGTTTPVFNNIANMATPYPPVTAQLIACSKADGTPTSLNYRIVITGMLVGAS